MARGVGQYRFGNNAGEQRTRNAVLVAEGLQLALGPSVKNPVINTGPGAVGILLGLVPVALNLGNQAVLGTFGLLLGLLALGLEEGAQLGGIPAVVGLDNIVVPVLLNDALQVLAVSWSRVRDVVVSEPALQLRLMPLVVDYSVGSCQRQCMALDEGR